MNLVGDPAGLEELKKIKAERKDFLKHLLTEVKTNIGRTATFRGSDGRQWKLVFNPAANELKVGAVG